LNSLKAGLLSGAGDSAGAQDVLLSVLEGMERLMAEVFCEQHASSDFSQEGVAMNQREPTEIQRSVPSGGLLGRLYAPVGDIFVDSESFVGVRLYSEFRQHSPSWMKELANSIDAINRDIREHVEFLDRQGRSARVVPPLDDLKWAALENTLRHASRGRLQIRRISP
jgi:hypothetical protein